MHTGKRHSEVVLLMKNCWLLNQAVKKVLNSNTHLYFKKMHKNQDCFTSEAALTKQLRKFSAFAL